SSEDRSNGFVVKARGLHKKYRDGSEALRGLDLEVREGDLFGLSGPDGTGKTTTLNIIAGVLQADSGEVTVFGRKPRQAGQQVGYVTQTLSLYPDLTVDEHLRYDASLCDVPSEEFEQRRAQYLKQMGLSSFTDRLASELSGGMAHKLAL